MLCLLVDARTLHLTACHRLHSLAHALVTRPQAAVGSQIHEQLGEHRGIVDVCAPGDGNLVVKVESRTRCANQATEELPLLLDVHRQQWRQNAYAVAHTIM